MKSIEELMAIRDKTRKNMTVREDTGDSKSEWSSVWQPAA